MAGFTLRSGLSRQILTWFLLLSLVPLCIISWIGYENARDQLYQNTRQALHNATKQQTIMIQSAFQRWITDIQAEAEKQSNSRFMTRLKEAYQDSGKTALAFTKSFQWAMLADELSADITIFTLTYEYHDVFLIHPDGDILFTVAKEEDLGRNIFQGSLADTRFAKAAKLAYETGHVVFSDLEYYEYSQQMAGFLVAPLLEEYGDKSGIIALQLSAKQIDQLLGKITKIGETGRSYLIGEDLTLRTEHALGEEYQVLTTPVKSELTQRWYTESQKNIDAVDNIQSSTVLQYIGPKGNDTLGLYGTIDIASTLWGFITEIDTDEALQGAIQLQRLTIIMIGITLVIVFAIAFPITRSIVQPILAISKALLKVSEGDLQQSISVTSKNEIGALAQGFNEMIQSLNDSAKGSEIEQWLQQGVNQINITMEGEQDTATLTRNVIGYLCHYLGAPIGAMYIVQNAQIKLMGSYAFSARKGFKNTFSLGEGMVGQAALERQVLCISPVPENYFAIASGLGEISPSVVCVTPLLWNDQVLALVEFGTYQRFNAQQSELINRAATRIAIAVQTSLSRSETHDLLLRTQNQSEEIQARETELQNTNRTLEKQTEDLRQASEAQQQAQISLEEKNNQLQVQQEELRVANELLEEKAKALQISQNEINKKNQDLEQAKVSLAAKAKDLANASQYKSEFLANMSHELRTPLNSLLILSTLLAENKDSNLTDKQVEFAQTIHASGSDLLNLINDILDLSKIESGKMEVHIDHIQRDSFAEAFQRAFEPLTEDKGIKFIIELSDAPDSWYSDEQKLNQIVKNFLSNAVKFTSQGSVTISIGSIPTQVILRTPELTHQNAFSISVSDTGIGIPEDKRQSIFEAFQQVDGTTSRHYGGTGLGLSISRELTRLLGGEIHIDSTQGQGSRFTLYIPKKLTLDEEDKEPQQENPIVSKSAAAPHSTAPVPQPEKETIDDRHNLLKDDPSLLIIEDDPRFSKILVDSAHEYGFKVLLASAGESGLALANQYQPSGIVLDIGLPGMDGWQVLALLKADANTRHIPVHFMSADDCTLDAMKKGAIGFLTKPVSLDQMTQAFYRIENIIERPMKRLLIVEDNLDQQKSLQTLIGNGDVETVLVKNGKEAITQLSESKFDCIVLDLGLPDMSGTELLESIRTQDNLHDIPVVVYTGKELLPEERATLNRYAQSIIIKDVHSPERLLDDTTLFLHRLEANMPAERRRMIQMLHHSESVFEDRKVLLVDDDMRNVFALSAILQEKSMTVIVAKNGQEALDQLVEHPDVAIILMDIMMPEMDGYEATEKIRAQSDFRQTPIIALTAKAMKGDRAKCIAVGANDYLAKPIDTEQLLSTMRVWLYQ